MTHLPVLNGVEALADAEVAAVERGISSSNDPLQLGHVLLSAQAKRSDEKSVSEMTYFVP